MNPAAPADAAIKANPADLKNEGVVLTKTESNSSGSLGDEKLAVAELESDETFYQRGMPDSLRSLSEDEIRDLEKKLVRKLDIRIMPIVIIMFLLNIIGRNGLTNAKLDTLNKDLSLNSHQYQTALMLLYVGYLLFQVPSNMVIGYTRPSLYLPGCMALWGVVSACTGATKSYGGLVACRLALGFLEAPFLGGVVFLFSCFYKKSELVARIAMLYCGNSLSNAFGGLFAAGILRNLDGVHGLSAWRYIFIIEGAATVGVAAIAAFLLPDWPSNTRWLQGKMKDLAIYRISAENGGNEDKDSPKWTNGLVLAIKDPIVWLCVLMQHMLLVSQSYTYFFPTIVKTLGYNSINTLLLTAPPYFFAFVVSVFNAWHAGATNERFWHITIPMCCFVVGNILVVAVLKTGPRYFGTFLQALGPYAAFSLILGWISSSIARPKHKRAVALALSNSIANGSHLYTFYIYPDKDKPRFLKGGIIIMVASFLCIACAFSLKTILKKRNEEYEKAENEGKENANPIGFGFRYVY